MINQDVIDEIYKKYKRPEKNADALRIPYFVDLLAKNNPIVFTGKEIQIKNLEEFNPFKRFLVRSLNGIIEFDKHVAFVFMNHILFLSKENQEMHIHIKKRDEKKSLLSRILGK